MGSLVFCIHHKQGCKWSDELRKLKVIIATVFYVFVRSFIFSPSVSAHVCKPALQCVFLRYLFIRDDRMKVHKHSVERCIRAAEEMKKIA